MHTKIYTILENARSRICLRMRLEKVNDNLVYVWHSCGDTMLGGGKDK